MIFKWDLSALGSELIAFLFFLLLIFAGIMKSLKIKHVVLIISIIIIADQALKIWIKTTHPTGEVLRVFGQDWFRLHFIENPGMAWGWKFGNETGKMVLTLFRLAAVIFGVWYLGQIVKQKYSKGFIICASLIFAGALGNLIDSMFYGMIFDKGLSSATGYQQYSNVVASFSTDGYSSFLHGSVVDMLYFPLFDGKFPSWVPVVGGDDFEFFSAIFNIADASISIGVIALLIFQKRFFKKVHTDEPHPTVETSTEVSDNTQVL